MGVLRVIETLLSTFLSFSKCSLLMTTLCLGHCGTQMESSSGGPSIRGCVMGGLRDRHINN